MSCLFLSDISIIINVEKKEAEIKILQTCKPASIQS